MTFSDNCYNQIQTAQYGSGSILARPARKRWLFLECLLILGALTYIGWPGFMSTDSFIALGEARNGVTLSAFPAMVSYVWRVFDFIAPGQTLMWIAQNSLMIGSVAGVVYLSRLPWLAAHFLILLAFVPPVSGPMLVVWKDVPAAGFTMLAIAMLVRLYQKGGGKMLLALFLFASFMACAYRFNTAPCFLPLFAALFFCGPYNSGGLMKKLFMLAIMFVGVTAASYAINTYSIPDLRPGPDKSRIMVMTLKHDILGTMMYSKDYEIPEVFLQPGIVLDEEKVQSTYHPSHLSLTHKNFKLYFNEASWKDMNAVINLWFDTITKHPIAWLNHKRKFGKQLLGMYKAFPINYMYVGVDEHSWGVEEGTFARNDVTGFQRQLVHLFILVGTTVFSRIHFYALLFGTAACLVAWRSRQSSRLWLWCLLSGWVSFGANVIICPVADMRYSIWFPLASFAAMVLAGQRAVKHKRM